MQKLAQSIVAIIKDYHNYRNFQFTPERVVNWVKQFDQADKEFILEEFFYLLKKNIYLSETKAREKLIDRIEHLTNIYNYDSPVAFLANADILSLQQKGKSQQIILQLLDEELQKTYGIGLIQCGSKSKKHAVYFDDILATGGTFYNNMNEWLPKKGKDGISNIQKLVSGKITLAACFFCYHNGNTTLWRLKEGFKEDKLLTRIRIFNNYEVQNHLSFPNQRLNFAYPVTGQPKEVTDYFDSLPEYAHKYDAKAFRDPAKPKKEEFFSSSKNRIRFENILLQKGIELLAKAEQLKDNHRPMGATIPSYRTLGTGTLYFNWQNISNTCPIVFWWDAGVWLPLFPLKGRGVGNTTNGT
jgi:hypothetical protein